MEKPTISKYVFKVTHKENLTPHYIRIKLKSDDDIDFDQCTPGANNKIFIPPLGTKEVQFATFNSISGEWEMPHENVKPIVRTYTHRAFDPQTKEITIDFVNHGENGPASAWARNAIQNDQLGVAMKIRPTLHYPDVNWYLLIGDATAIPVLSCILESLPLTAKGHCIIEIPSEEDKIKDINHPGFNIQWLINPRPESGSNLAEQSQKIEIPSDQSKFAYIACEYNSVKNLRAYFKEDLGWTNKEFYAFSYWKAGVAEDKSAQERRQEKQ